VDFVTSRGNELRRDFTADDQNSDINIAMTASG
jgi:hypothetical protein